MINKPITKPEEAIPHSMPDLPYSNYVPTKYFTVAECAEIAINYSMAVLDYVNGKDMTQLNGKLLKQKYDSLFSQWLLEGAVEKAAERNAKEIARRTDMEILEDMKLLAKHRGDVF